MPKVEKVVVIGLDCAEPSLVFEAWADHLPNMRRLMNAGTYGELTSCMPPITVPAWSCMAASRDPGTLGIYGFRNRADYSYDKLSIATSLAVKEPRLWDLLGQRNRPSIVVGVPGTYPITRPVHGCMLTGFLTPDTNDPKVVWTHPAQLREEVTSLVGEYLVDVRGFRTDDKRWLLEQIYAMTEQRFRVVQHLMTTRPWDLLFMVEMGVDRIHHGFWAFMDPDHHRHVPGNEFQNAIYDYYRYVDDWIGKLLACVDPGQTACWIVSDHGAKCMTGGFLLNQWLINEGYLTLWNAPPAPKKFDVADVDWTRTVAWGEGGYYGRVFLNVAGREPNGRVSPGEYENVRDELIRKLESVPDHQGRPMGNRCYKPQEIYARVNGVPPDLIVILGDLRWRSVGLVGGDSVFTFENDTGPDDANHARQGMYIYTHPGKPPRGRVDGPTLYDVAPTILSDLDMPIHPGMKGTPLLRHS